LTPRLCSVSAAPVSALQVIYFEHHRSEQGKLDAAAAMAEASAAAAALEASLADDLRDFALHDMSFPQQSNTAQLSATNLNAELNRVI
jgi:hypothetical protein